MKLKALSSWPGLKISYLNLLHPNPSVGRWDQGLQLCWNCAFISCKVKRNKPCPRWCSWSTERALHSPGCFPWHQEATKAFSQPTLAHSLCTSGRGRWHEAPEMEKTAFPNDLLRQVLTELLWKGTLWRDGRIKPNPGVVALLGRGFCTAQHSGRVGITSTQTLLGC